ncbi:MAG: N-acetyltransferase [Myxococcota bacterium]
MPHTRARSSPSIPAFAVRAADVQVEEVAGGRARDEFIRFQLDHYAGDARFVPPIVAERRDFLDPKENPFFEQARAALFLARRHGKVVGRIAAVVDSRYNRFHGTQDGFIGLFESQNDPGLAAALFEAALGWLKREGARRCVGPVSLAFHHEVGLQVHGHERFPAMMMPYNPPFYAVLFEANGFQKLKDLYSYEVQAIEGMPEKVRRLAERVKQSGQVRVRRLDVLNPETDLVKMQAIFHTMLKPGFGFAPMTRAEFMSIVNRLRPLVLLRPELSLIAEVDGETVGFAITVPDTHVAQKEAGGYLFPFGLAKMLWKARSIARLRGLMFGIKDGWRRRGIDALLAYETFAQALALGYQSAELGWAMEDDTLVNRMLQATGGKHVKTFRLYQRPL